MWRSLGWRRRLRRTLRQVGRRLASRTHDHPGLPRSIRQRHAMWTENLLGQLAVAAVPSRLRLHAEIGRDQAARENERGTSALKFAKHIDDRAAYIAIGWLYAGRLQAASADQEHADRHRRQWRQTAHRSSRHGRQVPRTQVRGHSAFQSFATMTDELQSVAYRLRPRFELELRASAPLRMGVRRFRKR